MFFGKKLIKEKKLIVILIFACSIVFGARIDGNSSQNFALDLIENGNVAMASGENSGNCDCFYCPGRACLTIGGSGQTIILTDFDEC